MKICPILDGNKLQLIFVYVWQQNRTYNIENKIKPDQFQCVLKSFYLRIWIELLFIRPSPFGVKTKLFPDTISIMSVNHVLAFFVISQGENLVLNIEHNFFN